MMPWNTSTRLAVLLLVIHTTQAIRAANQFQNWYPEFAATFKASLRDNCTEEYRHYVHGTFESNNTKMDTIQGADHTNQLVEPVVNCILSSTSEFIKSAMVSAQVLLGLTPAMLAVLGPSIEETSVLFVVGRRPLLAILLAAGCPAVLTMHAFNDQSTVELLKKLLEKRTFDDQNTVRLPKERGRLLRPQSAAHPREMFVMILQYILAAGAIVNTIINSRKLGIRVVCNFAPHITYLFNIWAVLALAIHGFSALSLCRHIRVTDQSKSKGRFNWIIRQFKPLSMRDPVDVEFKEKAYLSTFFSWLIAMLSVVHVIGGTLMFSSMLFISVRDSLMPIGLYMASVIVCRGIVAWELDRLRMSFKPSSSSDPSSDPSSDSRTELSSKSSTVGPLPANGNHIV